MSSGRILIADDDRDIRDLVTFKLKQAGYDVVTAENGAQAYDLAHDDDQLDLAVLDVMMPALTGIEVCRKLRDDRPRSSLPVILLTAKAQEGDLESGFAAGADDYVTKPFSPHELVSRIGALLADR